VSYSPDTERTLELEWCIRMVAGPGWDEYVIDRAKKLAKADQFLHRDLPTAVRKAIEARKASQPQPMETSNVCP
jgi:hypothetical protein